MNIAADSQHSEIFAFVPSHNHAPFVEKCLRSIIKQTLSPKKLLVIDDGSKDDSPRIIERVLKDCPFDAELKVQENQGLCATLNQGLIASDGEFFAYIGSDDIWLPEFLARRSALLSEKKNAALAFGHGFLIDEADRIIDCTADWTDFADGDLLPQLLRGQIFPSASVVYRRSELLKYGWNEDSPLEDYELYLKLAAEYEFAFDPQILCAWRQHENNVSGDFPLMLNEWIAAQNRVAGQLQLSRRELDKMQTELKFDAVLSFVRHGERRAGFKLFRENLRGAQSAAHIAKTLFRLAVPAPLFDWNRTRKRQRAISKNGALKLTPNGWQVTF